MFVIARKHVNITIKVNVQPTEDSPMSPGPFRVHPNIHLTCECRGPNEPVQLSATDASGLSSLQGVMIPWETLELNLSRFHVPITTHEPHGSAKSNDSVHKLLYQLVVTLLTVPVVTTPTIDIIDVEDLPPSESNSSPHNPVAALTHHEDGPLDVHQYSNSTRPAPAILNSSGPDSMPTHPLHKGFPSTKLSDPSSVLLEKDDMWTHPHGVHPAGPFHH